MYSAVRLLHFSDGHPLSAQFPADMQLPHILQEKTIAYLLRPCTKEELLHRQELFILLWDDRNALLLRELLSDLHSLSITLDLLSAPESEFERLYQHYLLLGQYLGLCEHLTSLSFLGAPFLRLAQTLSTPEQLTFCEAVRSAYDRADTLFAGLRQGILSFSSSATLMKNRDAKSLCDTLCRQISSLGISLPARTDLRIRVNRTLSNAITEQYPMEIAEITGLLSVYPPELLSTPLELIDDLKFILDISALILRGRAAGLPVCIPQISDHPLFRAEAAADPSLLAKEDAQIVPNDIRLEPGSPFAFLVGANGGGKTPYLRTIGINFLLFRAGCPIFARSAEIYPFPYAAAHFPTDERFSGVGRLQDEHLRLNSILASAAVPSLLLLNETFSGTDAARGFRYLCDTAEMIKPTGHFGVWVTHFHEVTDLGFPILTAEIDPQDENRRTYRITSGGSGHSSFAADILRKYRLDPESLKKRGVRNVL